MKYLKLQKIFIVLMFVLVYGFLIYQIPWQLVFSDTMIAGGDTGSHNYIAYYAQEIFPKIKWWSPDWYAGFPFLYFYPPLLYYITVILSFFIPLNIAFKLITLAGTFLLPLSIFLCLYLLDFKFPIPSIGALLSLSYLFLEEFSIYGGNIPSTLAGEFSYSCAFALFFIFIGLLIKGIKENKYLILNILILSLLVLIHPFPVMVSVLIGVILFIQSIIQKETKRVFWYLAKVFGLAFALTAFWSLPFLALLPYTSKMQWTKVIKLSEIFPSSLIIFQVLAILGFFLALIKKDKRIIPFLYIIISSLIPFLVLNHSSIWNTRFLPFIIMGYLMLAAYGLGYLLQKTKKLLPFICLLICSISFIFFYLPENISYILFWLKWNYEGFQSKQTWFEVEDLADYLVDLPHGRVMWEYRSEYDKFGTPRVLENLPIWINKPTFEGLLIESSLSGYFHFLNQAETTETPTAAIAGIKYPPFDFEKGVRHLQYFGAQYFVAFTPNIKNLADKHLIKLNNIGEFNVYEVPNSDLVEVLEDFDLILKNKHWLDQSIDWYQETDLSKPIIFYKNKKELKNIQDNLENSKESSNEQAAIEIIKIEKDSLSFKTNQLGKLHLIKYTYFPGWQVKGGKGPYLISPSFMAVIPTEQEVILNYSYNLWDKIGSTMSMASLIVLILFALALLPL